MEARTCWYCSGLLWGLGSEVDASTVDGFSRASSWSSVAVVGGGVSGPFTMLSIVKSEALSHQCLPLLGRFHILRTFNLKLDQLDHLFSESNGRRRSRIYLVHRAWNIWFILILYWPLLPLNTHGCFLVYKIPPLTANEGHRANNWGDLASPLWKGRLRILENSKGAALHLEDAQTGELDVSFAFNR